MGIMIIDLDGEDNDEKIAAADAFRAQVIADHEQAGGANDDSYEAIAEAARARGDDHLAARAQRLSRELLDADTRAFYEAENEQPHVVDDLGQTWRYTGSRMRVDGDDTGVKGGYLCDSFAAGVRLLIEYGYLTPPPSLEHWRGGSTPPPNQAPGVRRSAMIDLTQLPGYSTASGNWLDLDCAEEDDAEQFQARVRTELARLLAHDEADIPKLEQLIGRVQASPEEAAAFVAFMRTFE